MTFNKYDCKKLEEFNELSNDKLKEILFELLNHLNLQVMQHYNNVYESHITLEPKEKE